LVTTNAQTKGKATLSELTPYMKLAKGIGITVIVIDKQAVTQLKGDQRLCNCLVADDTGVVCTHSHT
jgi:hypothetical protein